MAQCTNCGEQMTIGSQCRCGLEHDMKLLAEENARLLAENDDLRRQVQRLMSSAQVTCDVYKKTYHCESCFCPLDRPGTLCTICAAELAVDE